MSAITIKTDDYNQIVNHIKTTNNLRASSKVAMLKIFSFLHHSGARVNEALKLEIADIRTAIAFGEMKIYTSKTKKFRTIQFTNRARDEFKILFENELKFRSDDEKIFVFSIKSMTERLNTVIKEALHQRCGGTHGFRRGIITEMLIDKKIDSRVVQDFIGHTNIATTLTYYKPNKGDVATALNLVRG